MRERTPCVYMLASRRYGTLYTGVTSNLVGRVAKHREDTFDGFTARHGIKLLVWYEVAETMDAAIATEKRIKRYRREWKIKLIEQRIRIGRTWRCRSGCRRFDLAAKIAAKGRDTRKA